MKPQLRDLHITHDCKMEFNNKKAIVIYVPKQKASQKVHTRLVSRRRQNSPASTSCLSTNSAFCRNPNKQKHPRLRTLTAEYDVILDDSVFPDEVVKPESSQLIKVHLDKN